MRKTITHILCLLPWISVVYASPLWAESTHVSETFTFGVIVEEPVDSVVQQHNQANVTTHHAINVDYLHNIARALDMDFSLAVYNNIDDILDAVERKEIDGALGFSRTPEREKRFMFSKPLFESTVAQWYSDNKLTEFPQSRLEWACVKASTYCEHIRKHGPKKLKQYDNFPQAMQAVIDGQAQAIIGSFISISEYLDRHNITKGSLSIPSTVVPQQLRLITTKDNQRLVDKFNRILDWEQKGLNVRSIASRNRYHVADKLITQYRQKVGEQRPITYSTSSNAYPFFYTNKQGEFQGFLIDFFSLLRARTGLQFEYRSPITAKGDVAGFTADLVPVAYSKQPSTSEWKITKPFLTSDYVSMEVSTLLPKERKSNLGVLISLQKQGIVHLESWRDRSMVRFDDLSEMIEALKEGDIDIAYVPEQVSHAFVANGGDSDIVLGHKSPLSVSLAFAVPRGNAEVLPLMNALLDTIDLHEMEKLNQRYRQFSLNYGYSNAELIRIALAIFAAFFALIVIGYIGRNNLRLKIKLAESTANHEEKEKFWLKEIIQEINSRVFIHDANNQLVLSNCPRLRDGTCKNCQLKDADTQASLIDNPQELREVFVKQRLSQTHRTTNCNLDFSYVTRERKAIKSSVSGKPYVITILQDISEQKLREKRFLKAQTDAQSAVVARERFLATMSHELRTPIAGVHGLLDLLQMKIRDQELNGIVEQAQSSISHLNQLVDEILDFSKIDAGEVTINPTRVDLLGGLCESIRAFETRAEQESLQFRVNIEPFAERYVHLDGMRVTQIIANLLSNAIKFTHEGFVQVSVRVKQNSFMLSVTDSGIGMSEKQQQHVLKPFTQADDSITREFGGTGLGLAIVDKIINAMNGELTIHSEPNSGSKISVTLPFESVEQPPLVWEHSLTFDTLPHNVKTWLDIWEVPLTHSNGSTQSEAMSFSVLEQKYPDLLFKAIKANQSPITERTVTLPKLSGKVLVAEDNPLNRSILSMQLRELGVDFVMVNDGQMAKLQLEQHVDFDLLISDFHMPKVDGPQLANYVRQSDNYKELPIIALTAEDKRLALTKAQDCGINTVLTKPYNLEQFVNALAPFMSRSTALPTWLKPFELNERAEIAKLFVDTMRSDMRNLKPSKIISVQKRALHSIKGGLAALQITPLLEQVTSIEQLTGDKFSQSLNHFVSQLEAEVKTASSWIKVTETQS